jgi:hypothetical protein
MNAKKKNENGEILDRINQFTRDADWSIEELRADLRNEGVDPDELIKKVRQRINPLLQKDNKKIDEPEQKTHKNKFTLISNNSPVPKENEQSQYSVNNAPTLLALICQVTTDTPSLIAQTLGITTAFMKLLNDYCKSIPRSWKRWLIKIVCEKYPLNEKDVEAVVEEPRTLQKAAFRSKEYKAKILTPEEILKISRLSDETQKFWLDLSREK